MARLPNWASNDELPIDFSCGWQLFSLIAERNDDVAKAVVFLASDYAAWITGIDLPVDGGTHLRGLPDYTDHLLGGSGDR